MIEGYPGLWQLLPSGWSHQQEKNPGHQDKETEGTGTDHEGTTVVFGTATSVRIPLLAASRGEHSELWSIFSDQLQLCLWFGIVQILEQQSQAFIQLKSEKLSRKLAVGWERHSFSLVAGGMLSELSDLNCGQFDFYKYLPYIFLSLFFFFSF